MQASRSWNLRFDEVIKAFGFIQVYEEASLALGARPDIDSATERRVDQIVKDPLETCVHDDEDERPKKNEESTWEASLKDQLGSG